MRPPRRSRLRRTLPWLTALLLAAPFPVSADDVEPPLPPLAGAEEVGEAMARFEEDFKARGLKGDDKLMQKDHAVLFLSGVPHPKVIDRLYAHLGDEASALREPGDRSDRPGPPSAARTAANAQRINGRSGSSVNLQARSTSAAAP